MLLNLTKVSSEYFNFECKLMDKLTKRDIICPGLQTHYLLMAKLNTVIYKIMTRLLFFYSYFSFEKGKYLLYFTIDSMVRVLLIKQIPVILNSK